MSIESWSRPFPLSSPSAGIGSGAGDLSFLGLTFLSFTKDRAQGQVRSLWAPGVFLYISTAITSREKRSGAGQILDFNHNMNTNKNPEFGTLDIFS